MKTSIWWIRRDLRIQNNPTLLEAISQSDFLLPLYILDPALLERKADKRICFLYQALDSLHQNLKELGSGLIIRAGNPHEVMRSINDEVHPDMIFAEEDYSPYARKRDIQIAEILPLYLVHGLSVFPPGLIVKNTGCPYTVFSHYRNAWKSLPLPGVSAHSPMIDRVPPMPAQEISSISLPPYHEIPGFKASEAQAHARLKTFLDQDILTYKDNRDRMDLDGTSQLSPYLRLGLISSGYIYETTNELRRRSDYTDQIQIDAWLNELIWREFYISILHHFPGVLKQSFRKDLRYIQWSNDESEFSAWKEGMTGYPIVDAGMRQLSQTGWMHNRARMITASFLTKDLLVNWQKGEEWFMQQLIDGDPATNNGGWQWVSGVGTDAAPYFRIFNPVRQGEKFDPTGAYIRKWIPELSHLPNPYIHKPWLTPIDILQNAGIQIGRDYPAPIIDHNQRRKATLGAFRTGEKYSTMNNCREKA